MTQVSVLQLVWNILFRVGLVLGLGVGPGPVLTSHKSRGDLRQFFSWPHRKRGLLLSMSSTLLYIVIYSYSTIRILETVTRKRNLTRSALARVPCPVAAFHRELCCNRAWGGVSKWREMLRLSSINGIWDFLSLIFLQNWIQRWKSNPAMYIHPGHKKCESIISHTFVRPRNNRSFLTWNFWSFHHKGKSAVYNQMN